MTIRRFPEKYLWILCATYGLGCAVSQSLMSFMGTVFAILGITSIFGNTSAEHLPTRNRFFLYAGTLAWVLYSSINLCVRPWDEHTFAALRDLPLLCVPLAAFAISFSSSRSGDDRLTLALKAIVISLGVSGILSAYQFFIEGVPATAFLRNPIYLAYNLLPPFIFFAELTLLPPTQNPLSRRWSLAAAAVCALGILCTISRMPLTLVLLYLIWRPMSRLERSSQKHRALAILVLLSGSFLWTLYRWLPAFHEKIHRLFDTQDPSRVWRLKAWAYNWNLFIDSPLWGVGAERNGIDVAQVPELAGHWMPHHLIYAHNIYLQALADSGLIGFLLFFAIWVIWFRSYRSLIPLFTLSALSGLTENIFNNSKAAHSLYFYTLMTVLLERKRAQGTLHESA